MDMNFKQTVTLTPEQVKDILADYVSQVFGFDKGTVAVALNADYYTDFRGERGSPQFKNAVLTVTTKGKKNA